MRAGRGRAARLIVTDSVFSMDGDVAPLAEIVELAAATACAWSSTRPTRTGALGPGGRGAVAEAGLEDEVDVVVGTLGKALGSYGAFVACDQAMAQLLVNTARPFIFSTAPPPPAVAGALAALELLERAAPARREAAGQRATRCATSSPARASTVAGATTQIVPLVVGEAARRDAHLRARPSSAACSRRRSGRRRCPTGTSRLRLAVMASHTPAELREAAQVLGRAALQAGWRPGEGVPVAAAPGGCARRRPTDRSTSSARPRRRAPAALALRGCFVTGTDTGVGKTVLAAALVAALRAEASTCARQARGHGPRRARVRLGPLDHELLARRARRAGDEVTPLRFGPAVSPHLAAELAGAPIEPAALVGPRACGSRADVWSWRASAACSCRSTLG